MTVEVVDAPPPSDLEVGEQDKNIEVDPEYFDDEKVASPPYRQDPYGNEEFAEVKYKVLKWWYVVVPCGNNLIEANSCVIF